MNCNALLPNKELFSWICVGADVAPISSLRYNSAMTAMGPQGVDIRNGNIIWWIMDGTMACSSLENPHPFFQT
jgi:hypothetical protein